MIPRNKVQDVQDHLGEGESQAFTIAVTGKAFRVLIDDLYSNKILSIVRELWSNARDSHVEAGKADVPFHCDLPTNLSPVFRVRDFGTGLSHDDVMHLYTTIFSSSKTDSNAAVGMLGLGSKSPFSYTDSFSVVAYDGQQKRTYIAFIQKDGVPSIRHISTDESVEERGLEVSFAVRLQDYREFKDAAKIVGYGFDVHPICEGVELESYVTFLKLGNVRIVENIDKYVYNTPVKIKQGCVLYPVDARDLSDLVHSGKMIIVEVPIGSVDVTASRESLSMDDQTKNVISKVINEAKNQINTYVTKELNKTNNRRERVLKAAELSEWSRSITREDQTFYLYPDHLKGSSLRLTNKKAKNNAKNYGIWRYKTRKEWEVVDRLDIYVVNNMRIIVDDESKIPRKASRIQKYVRDHTYTYIIRSDYGDLDAQKNRLKRLLGLKDSQFISLDDLPDVDPPISKRNKKEIPQAGELWALSRRGKVALPSFLRGGLYYSSNEVSSWWYQLFATLDVPNPWAPNSKIKFFTEKEAAKLNLPESSRVDIVLTEKLKTFKFNFDGYSVWHNLRSRTTDTAYKLIWKQFFAHIPMIDGYSTDTQLIEYYSRMIGQYQQVCGRMESKVKRIERDFPLLFNGTASEQAIMEYIKLKEAKP